MFPRIYIRSEATRQKMSLAQKRNPNRYWLGKKRSKEDRIKMGLPKKGKKNNYYEQEE